MSRVSVVVQACEARRALAEDLLERLAREAVEGVEILGMAVDEEMAGPWASAKKAWAMASGDHHLVLQEDAILCRGFLDAAKMLLGVRPGRVLSFYLATGATEQARDLGIHWVELRQILTGLAVAMPRAVAKDFLRWAAEMEACRPGWGPHDDTRMQEYYAKFGIKVLVPVPCLVQHDLSVHSTMGTGQKVGRWKREARWAIGDVHPATVDWDLGFDKPLRG